MAQLERRKKLSESSNSPKSQTSPSSDHQLKVEETHWATNASPNGRTCHDHEHEECPTGCPSHNKKSVLAKVKDTAKKLKYNLSGRRKHIDHHHIHDVHNHRQTHIHNHRRSHDDHNRRQSHDNHDHRQSHDHLRSHIHDHRQSHDDHDHLQSHDDHDHLQSHIHDHHQSHDDRDHLQSDIHDHCPSHDDRDHLQSHIHDHRQSHDGGQSHIHEHSQSQSHIHEHSQSQSHNHDDPNHCQSYSYEVHEEHHEHIAPCWTATLEDDYLNEKDYDPEYLGAPMYESEAAPECLKETARQHPRAVPVVSESHKAPNMTKHEDVLQESDSKLVSPNATNVTTCEAAPQVHESKSDNPNTNMITSMTQTVSEKLAPAINTNMITNMTQTVSDKLAPACAAVSDATHQINTNMIANVTGTVSEKLAPACAAVSDATHQIASKLAGSAVISPETQQRAHEASGYSGDTWGKGVSVKEYFLHKLEPGEDEKALSHAITEAISPRESTGEAGVVDKVKGAVTSLFWQEDSSNSTEKPEGLNSAALANSDIQRTVQLNSVDTVHLEKPARPSPSPPATSNVPLTAELNRVPSIHVRSSKILSTDNTISSPLIPVSNNALEVYEEENQGKILQTN